MTKPLYKRYAYISPIGYKVYTAYFGILFFQPIGDDKYIENCDFVCCYTNNSERYGFHRHKIHYLPSGRAYISKGNQRIYLDEILRRNI